MKERPILFSAPMVRALLAGTKSQTRRIVKPQPAQIGNGMHAQFSWPGGFFALRMYPTNSTMMEHCPYGKPGDRLWVRETWATLINDSRRAIHRADADLDGSVPFEMRGEGGFGGGVGSCKPDRWRPSIHMPRWASRITLEITGVRVERLQEISEADAKAEGIEQSPIEGWRNYLWHGNPDASVRSIDAWPYQFSNYLDAKGSYSSLWESINGAGSWDANPWVWVIEFKRLEAGHG